MRVPPDILAAKPKWQLPAVLLMLALTVFATGALTGSENRAIATQSNRITKLQVVVARASIDSGATLSAADIALEVRPIESLPEGVLTRVEEVLGKTSVASIPEGMPLAAWLFEGPERAAAPSTEPEVATEPELIVPRVETPTVKPLHEEPVVAKAAPPESSSSTERTVSTPAKVVTTSVSGGAEPTTIPPERPGPPVPEKAAATAHEPPVAERPISPDAAPSARMTKPAESPHGAVAQQDASTAPPRSARRKFSSYAWVAGERVTFGVSKNGKIQIVDENGRTTPLDDFRGEDGEE